MKRLGHTGIEYSVNPDGSRGYAWNFASGCGNNIEGKCKDGGFNCWAYSITRRHAGNYPNGFKPTIHTEAILSPLYLKKPSRILCAFMGDLFWDCPEFNPDKMVSIPMVQGLAHADSLKEQVYRVIRQCPQHQFLFLTKQPQNLIKWSPFPGNCEVGVTVCNDAMMTIALTNLAGIEAKIKYLSIEPLQGFISMKSHSLNGIKQVIIGSQTKPYKQSKIEWGKEIVKACDKAGIPVFLKDNLWKYDLVYPEWAVEKQQFSLRQELPSA